MRTLVTREPSTSRHRSLLRDLALAIATGFVAALAKRYLDFSLGIPGHAGVGWIAVLLAGRLINRRPGMAIVAGVSMGLWAAPVGINHTVGYNVALYSSAAAVLDTAALTRLPIARWWGAAAAGVLVHLAKFGYIFAVAWLSGIVRSVELYGFLAALRNHVGFGVLGGLAGWGLWRIGGTLRRRIARSLEV